MKQQDHTGFETLQVIAKADSFNRWMYKTIQPFCHGELLEIGSGIGNISKFFIKERARITLSDNDNMYVEKLKADFPETIVLWINLEHPNFINEYNKILYQYDSVFLLNVLEHIKNDELAIYNCHQLLKKGGNLIILTPSYPSFYSKMDKELHHFRRYTSKSLTGIILKNGFTLKKIFHFNVLGTIAWLYVKLLGLKKIPSGEMRLFNKMTGMANLLDKLVFNRIGLSIIAVAEKK